MDLDVPIRLGGDVAERRGLIDRLALVGSSEPYEAFRPFEAVFQGAGELKGVTYGMRLKPGTKGVVKPARRVAAALQDKVKAKLLRKEKDGVVAKVTEPTQWLSSMVVVVKDDMVGICLDTTDLKKVLL